MLDVIDLARLGMSFAKDLNPSMEVGTMIIDDRSRNAGLGHGVLQAYGHGLLGRTRHRHQRDRLHVLMAKRPAHGKVAKPYAQDEQAFALADLD